MSARAAAAPRSRSTPVAVGVLLLLATTTAACDTPAPDTPAGRHGTATTQPVARFEGNGVAVTATLRSTADGSLAVEATFRPQEDGFHLYSIDLPRGGVDGLGVPTTLAVRGALSGAGAARADKPVHPLRYAALDLELPVYPDGPVTLTLPVTRTAPGAADVIVSYAACSPHRCLPPVVDQVIALR